METTTIPQVETPRVDTEQGDHDTFAHIVRGTRRKRAEDIVLEARINGIAITAVCGKRWIPQRDPARFPICPTCLDIVKRARGAG